LFFFGLFFGIFYLGSFGFGSVFGPFGNGFGPWGAMVGTV
jgi:hypothetical protein